MKKIIAISSFLIGSLTFAQNMPVVGGDKDAHGCKGSAGYTYSQIKHDCIRTFEQKIQLKEVKPAETATFRSAVIFSKDMKQAEIFLPDVKSGSTILTRQVKSNRWKNGSYMLESAKNGRYMMKKNNKIIYGQM